jgi:NTP pyrophosphatase (non-canonical NTP hydrolase)
MELKNEFQSIRDWAEQRNLYIKGDTKTQFVKLLEEVGELSRAILTKNPKELKDAIGDIVVVLTNLTELANNDIFSKEEYEDIAGDGGPSLLMITEGEVTIEDCINSAFNEIRNRKGKMENGTFKKD